MLSFTFFLFLDFGSVMIFAVIILFITPISLNLKTYKGKFLDGSPASPWRVTPVPLLPFC